MSTIELTQEQFRNIVYEDLELDSILPATVEVVLSR